MKKPMAAGDPERVRRDIRAMLRLPETGERPWEHRVLRRHVVEATRAAAGAWADLDDELRDEIFRGITLWCEQVPRGPMAGLLPIIAPSPLGALLRAHFLHILREPGVYASRSRAADVLGFLPGSDVSAALLAALGDPSSSIRESAARALGELGEERAASTLAARLDDEELGVREAALAALARLSPDVAVPLFKLALHHADSWIRGAACGALVSFPSAAPALLAQAGEDAEPEVRLEVVHALAAVDASNPALDALAKDEDADVRLSALALKGDRGAVMEAAKSPEAWLRAAGLRALALAGSAEAIGRLEEALGSSEMLDRLSAAEALGKARGGDPTGALVRALGDEHFWVRRSAAEALERRGTPEAGKALQAALHDEDWTVRVAALRALGALKFEPAAGAVEGVIREALAEKKLELQLRAGAIEAAIGALWRMAG